MKTCIWGWALTLGIASVNLSAQPVTPLPARSEQGLCEALASVSLPELGTVQVNWIPGATIGPAANRPATRDNTNPMPATCRVRGIIEPAIRFELWLPGAESWNGRFLGLGNERIDSTIDTTDLQAAVAQGYAVAGSDISQQVPAPAGLGDDGIARDFSYRAIYEMTAKARALLSEFYGDPEDYAYFNGCSLGGRQALMQAQHFPEDYDGIVAGSPVTGMVDTLAFQLWLEETVRVGSRGSTLFAQAELELLHDAVIAQCDTFDGVLDGSIDEPGQCRFDPARLQCGAGSGRCLNTNQVQAARSIYNGPAAGVAGALVPGLAAGSELNWLDHIDGEFPRLARDLFSRLERPENSVMPDSFGISDSFDIARDLPLAREQFGWMLDADAPDLSAFAAQGGKLIVYHGWNDTLASPAATRNYLASVQPGPSISYARLFMLPATGACAIATADTPFPGQSQIENWVEQAISPVGIRDPAR